MLYLIQNGDYLKIGFATDVEKRMKDYRTYTLCTKLLGSKPGTKKDETALHNLCKPWQVESEWFENCKEVMDIWNNYDGITQDTIDFVNNIVNDRADQIRTHLSKYLFGEIGFVFKHTSTKEWEIMKSLYEYRNTEKLGDLLNVYYSQENFAKENSHIFTIPSDLIKEDLYTFRISQTETISFTPEELLGKYERKLYAVTNEYELMQLIHRRVAKLRHIEYESACANLGVATYGSTNYSVYWKDYLDRKENLANIINIITLAAEDIKLEDDKQKDPDFYWKHDGCTPGYPERFDF